MDSLIETKRPVGRPRKVTPESEAPKQAIKDDAYDPSCWYLEPADRNDEAEFERLLNEKRQHYLSPEFNYEIAVFENDSPADPSYRRVVGKASRHKVYSDLLRRIARLLHMTARSPPQAEPKQLFC